MCSNLDFSGGRMENFITRASGVGWRVRYAQVNPNVSSDNTAAPAHAIHSRSSARDLFVFSSDEASREPDGVDNASSAKPRSLAVWNLRSGFFSKQRRMIFSNAREVFAFVSPRFGGSSFRIAFITSIDDSPPNARLPDNISYRITPKLKMSAL